MPLRTLLLVLLLAVSAAGRASAEDSVAFWREQLGSPDPAARTAAAHGLALSEGDAADAVPDLARALRDADPGVRTEAAGALAAIGRPAGSAAGDLARVVLGDTNPQARDAAARAISRLGPWAHGAVPVLVEGMGQAPVPAARRDACEVLGGLGVATPAVAEALVQVMLRDGDFRVRAAARSALKRLRVDLGDHVEDFTQALLDADPAVRATAAEWLGAVRPRPVGAVDSLVSSLVTDPSIAVREEAEKALRSMGPEAASAVPRLTALLEGGDRETREACALVLGSVSTGAVSDIDALIVASLRDPELSVRLAARGALVRLARTTPAVFDHFVATAAGAGPAAKRAAAIDTLGRLGEASAPAVPSLLVALREGTEKVREEAAHALGRVGAPAFDALLPLRRTAAWDRSQRVRDAADKAIKAIRTAAGKRGPGTEPDLGGPLPAPASEAAPPGGP